MKTQLSFANLAEFKTGLLAVLAVDAQTSKEPDAKPKPVLLTSDEDAKAAAAAVLRSGEYKAGANETLLLHAPEGLAAKRLLIVGLGKQAFYSQIDLDQPKAYAYAKEVMSMNALAADAQEGIGAFLEKRSPCWRGE